jgi:hypothetical protein
MADGARTASSPVAVAVSVQPSRRRWPPAARGSSSPTSTWTRRGAIGIEGIAVAIDVTNAESIAAEAARFGVTGNAVAPGAIDTPLISPATARPTSPGRRFRLAAG